MHNQLAKIALDMLTKVSVPADDNSLEAARQVRNMLRGIANGDLEVVTPKRDAEKPE